MYHETVINFVNFDNLKLTLFLGTDWKGLAATPMNRVFTHRSFSIFSGHDVRDWNFYSVGRLINLKMKLSTIFKDSATIFYNCQVTVRLIAYERNFSSVHKGWGSI